MGWSGEKCFRPVRRLYLAAGVTTARTTGSIEPYADLNIKQFIDSRADAGTGLRRDRPVP